MTTYLVRWRSPAGTYASTTFTAVQLQQAVAKGMESGTLEVLLPAYNGVDIIERWAPLSDLAALGYPAERAQGIEDGPCCCQGAPQHQVMWVQTPIRTQPEGGRR